MWNFLLDNFLTWGPHKATGWPTFQGLNWALTTLKSNTLPSNEQSMYFSGTGAGTRLLLGHIMRTPLSTFDAPLIRRDTDWFLIRDLVISWVGKKKDFPVQLLRYKVVKLLWVITFWTWEWSKRQRILGEGELETEKLWNLVSDLLS